MSKNKINIKHLIVLSILLVLLSACTSLQANIVNNKPVTTNIPTNITETIPLFNAKKKQIGYAIRIETNLYLAPDHLFEKNKKQVFYKNTAEKFSKIKVKIRDFSHDILFFSLPQKPQKNIFPALIGENPKGNMFYKKNQKINTTKFHKKIPKIQIEHLKNLQNIYAIPQIFEKGDSGLPFTDTHGNLSGILIATNPTKKESYILPANQIQKVYEDGYLYSNSSKEL